MAERPPTLFELMPEVYRRKDRAAGGALEALLNAVEAERRLVARDIDQMYENWFAETADADGLQAIAALFGAPDGAYASRATVADTIACRRRKGTAAAAMRWITAQTGWIAEVDGTVNPRSDHHPTLKVWRGSVFPVEFAEARPLGEGRFSAHPFGLRVPLYRAPQPRYDIDAPFTRANAPTRVTGDDLDLVRVWRVTRGDDGDIVEATELTPRPWASRTEDSDADDDAAVYVDAATGHFFDPRATMNSALFISYAYKFGGDIGGGPYFQGDAPADAPWVATVSTLGLTADWCDNAFRSIGEAVNAFRQQGADGVIHILDSGGYHVGEADWLGGPPEDCAGGSSPLRRLTIRAAEGQAPRLGGAVEVRGADGGAHVSLQGLWITDPIHVRAKASILISHSTIDPYLGRPSLVLDHGALHAKLSKTICGPILIIEPDAPLAISDCILDAKRGLVIECDPGSVEILRSTVLGDLKSEPISAVDSIIVDPGSVEGANMFRSTDFGDPHYCRLTSSASDDGDLRARNGSEKGVFNFQMNNQRNIRLGAAIRDYTPAGVRLQRRR